MEYFSIPEDFLCLDAQRGTNKLWFGTPQTSQEISKILKKDSVDQIILHGMCKILPSGNDCDGCRETNWYDLFKESSALLSPGGQLVVLPCYESGLNPFEKYGEDLESLGFDTSSIQSKYVLDIEKNEYFYQDLPPEPNQSKNFFLGIEWIIRARNAHYIRKKDDAISQWLHSQKLCQAKADILFHILKTPETLRDFEKVFSTISAEDLRKFMGVGQSFSLKKPPLSRMFQYYNHVQTQNWPYNEKRIPYKEELKKFSREFVVKILPALVWTELAGIEDILEKFWDAGFDKDIKNIIKEQNASGVFIKEKTAALNSKFLSFFQDFTVMTLENISTETPLTLPDSVTQLTLKNSFLENLSFPFVKSLTLEECFFYDLPQLSCPAIQQIIFKGTKDINAALLETFKEDLSRKYPVLQGKIFVDPIDNTESSPVN